MPNLTRVGIVGTGWVGSSVAISTLHAGVAQELLLHDARTSVAEGEAMDLAHGAAFYPVAAVRAVSLDEMRTTDAVVIAAGGGGPANRVSIWRETTCGWYAKSRGTFAVFRASSSS